MYCLSHNLDTGNPFPADEELFNDEDLIKLYDDEELLDVEGVCKYCHA